MARLTDDEIRKALNSLPGWQQQGSEIAKTYTLTERQAVQL